MPTSALAIDSECINPKVSATPIIRDGIIDYCTPGITPGPDDELWDCDFMYGRHVLNSQHDIPSQTMVSTIYLHHIGYLSDVKIRCKSDGGFRVVLRTGIMFIDGGCSCDC